MQSLPWRVLVVTDAGLDSRNPAPVTGESLDGWLAALGAAADVPGPGGTKTRYALDGPDAFASATVTARIGTKDAAAIDAVLHHPAIQRAESAWRGLKLLTAEAGTTLDVSVISLPRASLTARFREAVFKPELESPDPLSLILLDFDFSHRAEDLAALADLAGMASALQAPLVAHASAGFFGLRYLVQVSSLPSLIERLSGPEHANWRAFQASEEARWVSLTINRYLQRAPYTADSGGYGETASDSNPDSLLWGRGVWLVGAALARSVRTQGHALDIAGAKSGKFTGLPTRAWATAANVTAPLAVEASLAEMQVLELSRAAFSPLVGPLRSQSAFLPALVTVFRLRPTKLTLEGTLAYQITAGRLAQACGKLLGEMPAGDAAECAAFLKRELAGFLGSLAGKGADGAVQVEAREETIEGRRAHVADVRVKPLVTLEGQTPEFGFVLPLRG
jgi:hypothetical protein